MANDRAHILAAIQREARQIRDPHAREVFKRAAVETGLVESNLSNPSGGDADSAGWRQERRSLYLDPTNIEASARRFRQEFEQLYTPGAKSYDVAARVQRPAAQYRGRYKQRAGDAAAVLKGGASYTPPSARTTTKTVGAVDNSQGRKDLAAQFLLGGPNAAGQRNTTDVLGLALAAQGLKDKPGHQVTTTSSSPGSGGAPSAGGSFAKVHSPLLELIHNTGSGPGYAVKNGQVVDKSVYAGVWAGHANHVHVAAGPKTIVELGKLAQQMGLHVGENPHFGGVNPVHVPGSYHYKGEAIDVSGDPGAMNQFAARIERLYKLKR